jgi:hypothetical protein
VESDEELTNKGVTQTRVFGIQGMKWQNFNCLSTGRLSANAGVTQWPVESFALVTNIKALRSKVSMTQEQFAARLDLSEIVH